MEGWVKRLPRRTLITFDMNNHRVNVYVVVTPSIENLRAAGDRGDARCSRKIGLPGLAVGFHVTAGVSAATPSGNASGHVKPDFETKEADFLD